MENSTKSLDLTEGKKLIANFMNISVYPLRGQYKNWKDGKTWKGEACDFELWEVQYDSSWDWLMPVVEKIEKIEQNIPDSKDPNYFKNFMPLLSLPIYTPIDKIYKETVKFIEWYNKNK